MVTESELKGHIEAVALRWVEEGLESRESRVDFVVSRLTEIALFVPAAKLGTRLPMERKVGKGATKAELQNLAIRLDAAIGALCSLHEPAIKALAEAGMVRLSAHLALDRMLNSVHAVDLSDVPADPKRGPSNLVEAMIMHKLANAYFHLTGKRPTRSASSKKTKSFTDFARKMLGAMDIKIGSIENAVKCECALWRKEV